MPSVVVIGAGVSGLAAASSLVKAGIKVVVLEARERIGGRTYTYVDDKLEVPMDLGGSFIHGLAGNPLHAFAKEHDLPLYRAGPPDQQTSYTYGPDGPPIPQELADRLGFNSLRTLFGSSKGVAQDRPDSVPEATDSLADYILNNPKSTLYDGLKSDTEKGYARAMSASWDGWTGASISDVSLRYWQSDVTYGGPDATMVDGYRGIYQRLADDVESHDASEIRLKEEATAIALSEDGDTVSIETKSVNGGSDQEPHTYRADYCICTLPLGVLQKRPPAFSPALPKRRVDATHRIGMGLLNKIIVSYPRCFWPSKQTFITLLPSHASESFMPLLKDRALFAQNYLPITGKNTLVFYCGAHLGSELEKKTDEEVAKGIHSVLAHHFKRESNDFPDKPDSVIVTRWESDPYSYGSYSYLRPAKAGEKDMPTPFDYDELARPLWDDRLFFAGEATDPHHYATVHGPLITGRRAAQAVVNAIEAQKLEESA